MGEAPALLVGQAVDVEREQIHVVGAGGEPGEELGALAARSTRSASWA